MYLVANLTNTYECNASSCLHPVSVNIEFLDAYADVKVEKAAESPIGWFSELISEISGINNSLLLVRAHNCCGFEHTFNNLALIFPLVFSSSSCDTNFFISDILSPEDFSQNTRLDQSRERPVPGINTPTSTYSEINQKDSFAEMQRRKTVVVGRHSTIKRKDEPDELQKMCGTWSGEIERCCTSCIIGRQRVSGHFGEDSGSLGKDGLLGLVFGLLTLHWCDDISYLLQC